MKSLTKKFEEVDDPSFAGLELELTQYKAIPENITSCRLVLLRVRNASDKQ